MTSEIPRGKVTTYGAIARKMGKPRASRAVGAALRANPTPIVVPCHRVVGFDGSLRGYGGGSGVSTKAKLLKKERVKFRKGKVDLTKSLFTGF